MFEDLTMLILNLCMFTGLIQVPLINSSSQILMQQFASTSISFVFKTVRLFLESEGLKEDFIMYLMQSMKAKLLWVPYSQLIKNRMMRQNIDFNLLEFKVWGGVSDATGFYMK